MQVQRSLLQNKFLWGLSLKTQLEDWVFLDKSLVFSEAAWYGNSVIYEDCVSYFKEAVSNLKGQC